MTPSRTKKFIFSWDIFITALATYAAIEIPLALVVNFKTPPSILILNQLVTVSFIIDVFIRFYRPRHRHANTPEHHNLRPAYPPGWLAIDILSAIPFDLIYYLTGNSFFGILALVRLLKVCRVISFRVTWLYHARFNPVLVRLTFFFYFIGLSAHWFACIWLALKMPYFKVTEHVDMLNQYMQSLYWSVTTITTIGYGDIVPDHTHNLELLFTMFVEIIGAGAYGYIIGNIANMLTNIDMAKARHQERVDRMNDFMKSKKISEKLQDQVHQYYNYIWETRKGYNDETILAELPDSFRFEFALQLNKSIIEKVPIFKGAEHNLVREVVFKLRPCVYIPGDDICISGEIGDKMYFINKGTVAVVSHDGMQHYATLRDGDFFGEIALLMKQPRNATIRAIDFCDLYSLDKESFDSVISNYPEFEQNIKKMAEERIRT